MNNHFQSVPQRHFGLFLDMGSEIQGMTISLRYKAEERKSRNQFLEIATEMVR